MFSRHFVRRWITAIAVAVHVGCGGWQVASATTVGALCAPTDDPCIVSTQIAIEPSSVLDLGTRALVITSTGRLESGSGEMTILAGSVSVESGGAIRAVGSTTLAGGKVTVTAGSIAIAGTVSVVGSPAGTMELTAGGALQVTGLLDADGGARDQSGGFITLDATTIDIAGSVTGDGSSEDTLGADIVLRATGNVVIGGEISVVGTDGGTVTVDSSAGDIILTSTSVIVADGRFDGGFGGSIDVTASLGSVRLDGELSVDGDSAGEEFGGGSGGCLTINSNLSVTNENPAALLSVRGGGPDGSGSELEITSTLGGVSFGGTLDISADGIEGEAGALAIDSVEAIEISGAIVGFGGDGGDVTLISAGAGVTIGETASIDVTGRDVGGGGAVCLETAVNNPVAPATILVAGEILADGGNVEGSGGSVDIAALDSVRLTGRLELVGGNGGGLGGAVTVEVTNGPAFMEGTIHAMGRGEGGGSVAVDAARIDVQGTLDVSGSGASVGNSDIGLTASGPITIGGTLLASSAPGPGGLIEVFSEGAVSIAGVVSADGLSEPGGLVDIRGCTVLVCGFNALPEVCGGATGLIRTRGPNGTNRINGRTEALIFGNMTADLSGINEILVPPPLAQNATVLGMVVPSAIVRPSLLSACPICGNNEVEPPETCDDGNTEDGDGCSADCRLQMALPGDVNGDFRIEQEDILFLVAEIFDGDGDRTADVSGGTFRGTPGADVNDDARINAADIVGLVTLGPGS